MPPLTCSVSPVIYDACSEDKNATELETSSPEPSFPIGILDVKNNFTFSAIFIVIFETIKPGDTQLIVIFFFAYSIAKLFDMAIMPAFAAA